MDLWTSVYHFIVVLGDRNTVDISFSKGTERLGFQDDLWTSVYRFMVVLVDRNTVDIYFSKGTERLGFQNVSLDKCLPFHDGIG